MNVTLDIDGPRDHEYVLEVAGALAEAPRVLNHLTMTHGAVRYANEVDTIVRCVATMASRLPQLCGQLAGWLALEQAEGRLEMHGGRYAGQPDMGEVAAVLQLDAASALAGQLQEALDAAARITANMATAPGGEEDRDG